jgi:hypothetical protein
MPYSTKKILVYGWLYAALLSSVACSPRRIPPMTVADLMEDRVTLDGALMKCDRDKARARTDVECLNARVASERLAKDVDPAVEQKREEDFERTREHLRLAQDKLRQEQEAKKKVDPYTLPVVPVEPAPPPPTDAPPLAGTARQ